MIFYISKIKLNNYFKTKTKVLSFKRKMEDGVPAAGLREFKISERQRGAGRRGSNNLQGKQLPFSFLNKNERGRRRKEDTINAQQMSKISEFYHFSNCSMPT